MDQRRIGYVLAVARANHVATPAGALRADAIAARLPAQARQRPSAFSNTSNVAECLISTYDLGQFGAGQRRKAAAASMGEPCVSPHGAELRVR